MNLPSEAFAVGAEGAGEGCSDVVRRKQTVSDRAYSEGIRLRRDLAAPTHRMRTFLRRQSSSVGLQPLPPPAQKRTLVSVTLPSTRLLSRAAISFSHVCTLACGRGNRARPADCIHLHVAECSLGLFGLTADAELQRERVTHFAACA